MKLGGKSGAGCHCSWGDFPKCYWVCGWNRRLYVVLCTVVLFQAHLRPPCCACAYITFFDGFTPGILTASWFLCQCGPLPCNWWPPLLRKLTGLLSSWTSPTSCGETYSELSGGTARAVVAQLHGLVRSKRVPLLGISPYERWQQEQDGRTE